jgi:hypothetical protein
MFREGCEKEKGESRAVEVGVVLLISSFAAAVIVGVR